MSYICGRFFNLKCYEKKKIRKTTRLRQPVDGFWLQEAILQRPSGGGAAAGTAQGLSARQDGGGDQHHLPADRAVG